jgi:hypothetical protein
MNKLLFTLYILIGTNLFAQQTHSVIVNINQTFPCGPTSNTKLDNLDYKLFPVPSNNTITIQHSEKIIKIQLFDLNGKQIKTITCNNEQVNMELNEIQNGIYLILITTEQKTIQEKIVVIHE